VAFEARIVSAMNQLVGNYSPNKEVQLAKLLKPQEVILLVMCPTGNYNNSD
jgi:hypothetical protein